MKKRLMFLFLILISFIVIGKVSAADEDHQCDVTVVKFDTVIKFVTNGNYTINDMIVPSQKYYPEETSAYILTTYTANFPKQDKFENAPGTLEGWYLDAEFTKPVGYSIDFTPVYLSSKNENGVNRCYYQWKMENQTSNEITVYAKWTGVTNPTNGGNGSGSNTGNNSGNNSGSSTTGGNSGSTTGGNSGSSTTGSSTTNSGNTNSGNTNSNSSKTGTTKNPKTGSFIFCSAIVSGLLIAILLGFRIVFKKRIFKI